MLGAVGFKSLYRDVIFAGGNGEDEFQPFGCDRPRLRKRCPESARCWHDDFSFGFNGDESRRQLRNDGSKVEGR